MYHLTFCPWGYSRDLKSYAPPQRLTPILSCSSSVRSWFFKRCSRFEVGCCSSSSRSTPQCSSYQGVPSTLLGLLTTMPRQHRPAFEVDVSASSLFKIPLEVRIMIYGLLPIQKEGMFIPSDIFARRNYGRTSSMPYECLFCGLIFLSSKGCVQHVAKHHRRANPVYQEPVRPLLPELSTSLLQTCRLIRL